MEDRRLRLIHSGRLLTDGTLLYSWITTLEERQRRATSDEASGTQQPSNITTWLHCSVGPKIESGEEGEDAKTQVIILLRHTLIYICTDIAQMAQLQPLRGFDRLSAAGFSESDIANFRRQFHSQSSSNYLDTDFDTEEECVFIHLTSSTVRAIDAAGPPRRRTRSSTRRTMDRFT